LYFCAVLKQAFSVILFLICLTGHGQSMDSLKSSIQLPDSLKQLHELDSVQQTTKQEFSKLKNQYDSIDKKFGGPLAKLQHQADSARKLNLPTDRYTKKMDSLTQLREGHLAGIKNKTEMLKEKSTAKIKSLKLPPAISKEAQQFGQGLNKLDVSLPDANTNFPSMPSLAKMPGVSMPGVNIPNANLPNGSLPAIGIDPNIAKGVGDVKIPEVKTPEVLGEAKQVGNQVGEISKVGSEIKDAKDKMNDPEARKEVLAKAEEKAADAAPVKEISEKVGMPGDSPLKDGQLTQDELKEQAKQQAIDHFAGKEEQVQAAMSQMSKLKQKYSSVQSIKDLPKKPPNPMKGKPFVERLVPALGFQILFRNEWLTDVNPNIGYRLSGRITAGLGWNQRWGFTKEDGFNSKARIYGPRAYGEVIAFKGIIGRLELEAMYTRTPPILKRASNYNDRHREWVPGIFGGIKKNYTIVKGLKGTVTVLYNLYNPDYKSPYGDRLMTRFGFEYAIKRKKKKV
jgi:hypothetical protein